MSAGTYNIIINQGSDFAIQFIVKQDSSPISLATYSARAQIRTSIKAASVAANFVCTIPGSPTGAIIMTLAHTVSSGLAPGIYFYDLEIYTAGNASVTRLLKGTVTIDGEVTR